MKPHQDSIKAISLDGVTADAMELSAEERAVLIERLVDTVLPAPPLHPSWVAEIDRRVADMAAGVTQCVPAEAVVADLRAMIAAHGSKA
jgi:putative addiction module component (TIGR02574 family)